MIAGQIPNRISGVKLQNEIELLQLYMNINVTGVCSKTFIQCHCSLHSSVTSVRQQDIK